MKTPSTNYHAVWKRNKRKENPEYYRKKSNEESRKWRHADPERARQKTRKWQEANPNKYLWQLAKQRSKRKGIEFTISFDDVVIPNECPVLGISLDSTLGKGYKDNAPSIDRINSLKGYTSDNIIVISRRANMIKNQASPEELRKVADFFTRLVRPVKGGYEIMETK